MSHRKDRARAEAGFIFREGRLWEKEEWYALHPTKETLRQQYLEENARQVQEKLDELKALGQTPATKAPYLCVKCGRKHVSGKIYDAHKEYASES